MKQLLFVFFLLTAQSISAQQYTTELEAERVRNNEEMRNEVLDSSERLHFEGICYFPIDTNYIVPASFTRKKGKKFIMPMTKARTVFYRQYGVLTFRIHDTLCELAVYENLDLKKNKHYKNYLFLPFRDGTTAISTYGGGRYLDLRIPEDGIWMIDFNKAYHPYCVYSSRYSCPIPPSENTVVPFITAGECYVPHE